MEENNAFLKEQIITYIGNKRTLLDFIGKAVNIVKRELHKDKIDAMDIFSGSGIVARYLKPFCNNLYVNDLEDYCRTINECYLANKSDIDFDELDRWYQFLVDNLKEDKLKSGFITEMYSPKDDNNIQEGERVFYTNRNARYIDTARKLINEIPLKYQKLFLGPLLYEASNKTNTSGVFKGFYKNSRTKVGQFGGNGKNALGRIMANIEIKKPVLSCSECMVHVYQEDANTLASKLPKMDLVYMDPPYNQHPYGSNYFMLNLINNYEKPKEVSLVSGIPSEWNKSNYNKKALALNSLTKLVESVNASYILISFSSEGFITFEEMVKMLSSIGSVRVFDQKYSTFKACRNLHKRNLYLKEYLFLLKKEEEC